MKIGFTVNNILRDHLSKLMTTFRTYYPDGKIILTDGNELLNDEDLTLDFLSKNVNLINPYDLPTHFKADNNYEKVDIEIIPENEGEEVYFKIDDTIDDFDIVDFLYNEASFEVFGRCDESLNGIVNKLSEYVMSNNLDAVITNLESKRSKNATMLFLSLKSFNMKEIYFPSSIEEMWSKFDIIVTDNPKILNAKPDNKKSIKINTWYNEGIEADYTYSSIEDLINSENNILK